MSNAKLQLQLHQYSVWNALAKAFGATDQMFFTCNQIHGLTSCHQEDAQLQGAPWKGSVLLTIQPHASAQDLPSLQEESL